MRVLLAYCMVPFIKLFGFNTVTVRLPMVLISSGAVALVYLVGRKLFSERIALVAMLLTAVNPWQFMQSRWSLDCNLFPHIFLLGFYLLLLGLEKRRYLYLSMVFFGLTFYCYGIAAYSVTAFLFVFFMWCQWKRRLKFREGLLCALIFTVVALPEVIVLGINAVHFGRTISTPLFTMPYFPDSVRSADILLLNFSFAQLGKNAWALFSHVFLQLPDIFFNSILNNGRNVLESRLSYKDGTYEIDFADLEEKLARPQTSMLIFCNPHNPVGKIWDRETQQKIGELCDKYHVLVLSDEIHCDLTEPGKDYIPFASVSDTCRKLSITCVAPTKAFNLAGIQTAAVIIPDAYLRHKVNRGLNTDEVAEPNVFALTAPIAAFTKGGAWLDELRAYLWKNRKTAEAFIKEEIPQISVVAAEATYLLWIDCTRIAKKEDNLCAFIRSHSGLYLCDGAEYRNGDGFLRMNLACPKTQVEDGLRRLKESVEAYQKRYAG